MAKTVLIEYKYPNEPWKVFDKTAVAAWSKIQKDRMIREFPGAEYRVRNEK